MIDQRSHGKPVARMTQAVVLRWCGVVGLGFCLALPARAQLGGLGDLFRNVLDPASSRCRTLRDWVRTPLPAGADASAMPATPASRRAVSRIALDPKVWFLVSDEVFEPRFGKRYEQLTIQDFRDFQRNTARACVQGGEFTPTEWQTVQALWNESQHASIVQMRQARLAQQAEAARARAEADAELQQLVTEVRPGVGLDRLKAIRSRAQALQATASPEARQAFGQSFDREVQTLVPDLLRQQVQEAVAQARSGEHLAMLLGVRDRVGPSSSGLGVGLSPDDPALVALQQRSGELAAEAAATERRSLDALPDALPGLAEGVQWQQRFQSRWGGLRGQVPELTAVETDFHQRRQAVLAHSGPALARAVQQATSVSEAQSMVGRYTLSSERDHASTRAMLAAVDERVRLIERNQALGRETPAGPARAVAAPETVAAVAEARSAATSPRGEPTEEIMYELVRQKFENAAARVKGLYSQCEGGGDRSNPMNAMMCLGLNLQRGVTGGAAASPTRILRFSKIGCEKSPSRPGFNCEYEIETDSPMNKQFQAMTGFNIDQSGLGQGRWVRKSDGAWLMITEE